MRGLPVSRIQKLPHSPGVYLFKDEAGTVIYVGKALDLCRRVRSYFQKPELHPPRVRALVEKIAALSYVLTDSESEAFVLESNLIKEYSPRYNVQFKDDKHYPYLRLNMSEPFPRLEVARRIEGKGYRYFGPYSSAGAMRETLRLIKKLFPLRSCRRQLKEGEARGRPCLNYQIKRCLGPCRGDITAREYGVVLDQVILFLEGRQSYLLKKIEKDMKAAARALEFEKAARLRDQYYSLQKVMERQKAVATDLKDRDVIALVETPKGFSIGLFRVRRGKLLGAETFVPRGTEGADSGEVMKEFLRHYYDTAAVVPGELLLSHMPVEKEFLEKWLQQKRGNKKIHLKVPLRGEKKALLELVKKNTLFQAQHDQADSREKELSLEELAALLELPEPPQRIEGYDISHLAGRGTVGSMVVFVGGKPWKEGYRRFKVRTAGPADDYAALAEVLERRFNNSKPLPALILIDGGQGQLSVTCSILEKKGLGHLPVIALAEEREQIFLPQRKAPLDLPDSHPALQLLQQVRDEAHRFALSLSRNLVKKSSFSSFLESVPGIGPVRRKALLEHFGGLEALRKASLEEIKSVRAVDSATAERLYRELQEINSRGGDFFDRGSKD
ncbi:MAG: excinuclease ABC subunit UvrC [Firmicutes bacterium]|nr:excinuclease ABC subunit UvrC [Bacillota bacterium]